MRDTQSALELYRTASLNPLAQLDADTFPTPEDVDAFLRENGVDPAVVGKRAPMVARNIFEWKRDRSKV